MKNINKKTGFNILAWIAVMAFFFLMADYFMPMKTALFSAMFDTMFLGLVFYFNLKYLFPKYYYQTKKYVAISFAFILVVAIIDYLLDVNFFSHRLDAKIDRPPEYFHFIRVFMGNGIIYFLATSVSLMQHNNRLIKNEKLLTEEKLETELKLLKAQINPHFIFNALNNIYSLTYMQSKNAPESVLKLSEMLRYVFYDCSKDKVPLSSEIKYIENFNSFQQMKSEGTQNITLQTSLGSGSIEIAPMLFIPFIENAFKYSRIEEEEAFVNISVKHSDKHLNFSIENSTPTENKPLAGSGTGIVNVEHRLNIIYPNKHVLSIDDSNDGFIVNLSIEV